MNFYLIPFYIYLSTPKSQSHRYTLSGLANLCSETSAKLLYVRNTISDYQQVIFFKVSYWGTFAEIS